MTTANLPGIKDSYRGLNSTGSTNWQDGLLKMQNTFGGFAPAPGPAPDLVVFITDGNPNTINTANGTTSANTTTATNAAIGITNAMKDLNVHMFGIAVGGPINLNPIKAVTSSVQYTSSPSNFGQAGYMTATSYQSLRDDLKMIAAELCGASVTITKQVKTPANANYVPASGWAFDTTVTIPDAPGNWLQPGTAPTTIPQGPATSTRQVTTNASGVAAFQWQPTGGKFNTTPVVVKETIPANSGYERDPVLKCTKTNVSGGNPVSFDVTADGTGNWNLTTALGNALTPGDSVACTAKNTLTKLNLKKVVRTGSANADEFRLYADPVNAPGAPAYSQLGDYTAFEPIAGDPVVYQLSETGPANYSGVWECTNGVQPNAQNQITVPKGTQTRCTVTNTRKTGTLTLIKTVSPDTAGDPTDWTLTATPDGITGQGNVEGTTGTPAVTDVSVFTGDYDLSESGPAGFTGTWDCDTAPLSGDKVTVGNNADVTCTLTNTRKTGTLTLIKTVSPDTAGDPTDWTLTATPDGITGQGNVEGTTGTPAVTDVSVFTGDYDLSESGPAGFTGTWDCDTAPLSGDKVTVGNNADVTCTLTNTRKTGTLTLIKTVSPDTAGDPTDWTLTATPDGITGQGNVEGTTGTPAVTDVSVFTGDYDLSESGPAGFTGTWDCDTAPLSGDKVTVGNNADVTCTLTNTRKTGTLTLIKTVSPDTAGDPTDWTLTATPDGITGQGNVEGTTGTPAVTDVSVFTGDYDLSESGPAGFTGTWDCDTAPLSGDKVTVGNNADVTCTLTNTRKTGTLTLIKTVSPDTAGDPTDWTLTATPDGITGQGNVEGTTGTPAVTDVSVFTGDYDLSESGPAGFTGTWDCDTAPLSGDKVTVGNNADVTCTLTNTRNTAKISLVKQVEGKGDPADWTLTADPQNITGQNPVSGNGDPNSPDAVKEEVVFTGTYTLSEDGPDKYTPGQWVCLPLTNGDQAVAPSEVADALNEGDSITLEKGDNIVCTIINTRDLAELKLIKQVEGKDDPNDWTLTAKAEAPDNELNISTPGGSGKFETVYAQTEYTLAETGPGGYSPSDWVCLPASEPIPTSNQVEGQLNDGDKITLEKGQRVECTIVNTRDLGSLKITKSFDPKTSGYDKAFNIGYKCQDEKQGTVSLKAGQSETITGIPTGTECQVTEVKPTDPPAGWSFSDPVYDPASGKVTVAEKGQTVSVTVTNEILKPGINIAKTGSATQVNPGETVTYTYTVTNTGDTTLNDVTVSDDKCAPVTYQSGDTTATASCRPAKHGPTPAASRSAWRPPTSRR